MIESIELSGSVFIEARQSPKSRFETGIERGIFLSLIVWGGSMLGAKRYDLTNQVSGKIRNVTCVMGSKNPIGIEAYFIAGSPGR